MHTFDLRLDVTDAVPGGEPLHVTVSVHLPEPDQIRPVVLFAYPGGGYGRRYYDIRFEGLDGYSEAEHHVANGTVVVACDHLCVGDSSMSDPLTVTYEQVALANHLAAAQVIEGLRSGTLVDGYPALDGLVAVAVGQSLGGCVLTVQQGRHRTFDGVGFLGWSGIHTNFPARGGGRIDKPFPPRGSDPFAAEPVFFEADQYTYCFHFDDEPTELVAADMAAYGRADIDLSMRGSAACPWGSATMPACAMTMMSPGTVAVEAAMIDVPVLVGVGERDVVTDPRAEPMAYPASKDITIVEVPRMSHMHNFASTRIVLWRRIDDFADAVSRGNGV